MDLTATAEWKALAAHYEEISPRHLRDLFAGDPERAQRMTATAADLALDYSKQRATDETLRLLMALARAAHVEERRDAMFRGEHINTTEDRAVLHVALRMPPGAELQVDGQDVTGDVHRVLAKMGELSERIRNGTWTGATGQRIAAVVNSVPCGNGPGGGLAIGKQAPGSQGQPQPSQAQIRQAASVIARMNYSDYARQFLYPSNSLMIKSGLWLELEAVIGFVVGLGLGSLIGQRTVAVVLMIVLEVVLTPILSRARIPHFSNLQRAVVGLATAHLTPGGLPVLGGGGGGPGGGGGNPGLLPESTTVAVCVIVAWLAGWSVLGAWRMMTRDA